LLVSGCGQDLRQVHREPGTGHDFIETRRPRFRRQLGFYVRKETHDAEIRLDGPQALDGFERGRPCVEIDDNQGRQRIQKLQQRLRIAGDFRLQAQVLGGFGQFHLKEKIVYVSYDARHR